MPCEHPAACDRPCRSATGAPAPAKPPENKNIFLKKVIFLVEKGLACDLLMLVIA